MEKFFSTITDEEWVRYHWIDVTGMRDQEKRFLVGRDRTPEEAAKAAGEIATLRDPVSQLGL